MANEERIGCAEYFRRGISGEPLPQPVFPKAPRGTNAKYLPLDGTFITGPNIPGQPNIRIDKERDPGECAGGICVEIHYFETTIDGESIILATHVNGEETIAPGYVIIGNPSGDEEADYAAAFRKLDDHLVKLGLLPLKEENTEE